jgi:prepilin-type processing-associated H-X9-DG protein
MFKGNCFIDPDARVNWGFETVADVNRPEVTPIWADGGHGLEIFVDSNSFRRRIISDLEFNVPRHGSRPSDPIPVGDSWVFVEGRLPGAVNANFADGHVEQVPLENLWKLYWHRDYVQPNGWGSN